MVLLRCMEFPEGSFSLIKQQVYRRPVSIWLQFIPPLLLLQPERRSNFLLFRFINGLLMYMKECDSFEKQFSRQRIIWRYHNCFSRRPASVRECKDFPVSVVTSTMFSCRTTISKKCSANNIRVKQRQVARFNRSLLNSISISHISYFHANFLRSFLLWVDSGKIGSLHGFI